MLCSALIAGCLSLVAAGASGAPSDAERRALLAMAPAQAPPPSPTNRWADDADAAALGRALFFDPGLSAGGRMSCASCHDPDRGWCDGLPSPAGVPRNTPSLLGAAHQRFFFWDGRADSLWAQALQPIEGAAEMAGSRLAALRHVRSTPALSAAWESVFGALPDLSDAARFPADALPPPIDPARPFDAPVARDERERAWLGMSDADRALVNGLFAQLGKAIEAFERTIRSEPSPFDRCVEGVRRGEADALEHLPPAARRGLGLFLGRAGCVNCHFGPSLSDGQFHNLGLTLREGQSAELARSDGIRKLRADPYNGRGRASDDTSWPVNQKLLTLRIDEHVDGAYRTPTLRDLGRTAPYMHDGRFATLEEVLRYYSELPGAAAVGHREETLQPLDLTEAEIADLAAFLRSLDGSRS